MIYTSCSSKFRPYKWSLATQSLLVFQMVQLQGDSLACRQIGKKFGKKPFCSSNRLRRHFLFFPKYTHGFQLHHWIHCCWYMLDVAPIKMVHGIYKKSRFFSRCSPPPPPPPLPPFPPFPPFFSFSPFPPFLPLPSPFPPTSSSFGGKAKDRRGCCATSAPKDAITSSDKSAAEASGHKYCKACACVICLFHFTWMNNWSNKHRYSYPHIDEKPFRW